MTDQAVEASGDLLVAESGAVGGKYLTFILGDETHGIGILKVQEIIGVMDVTKVPKAPSFVRGVINLRGKVIPVIDLRLKFEMEGREDTERTCIIVLQVQRDDDQVVMGVIVDEVSEVLQIKSEEIEPPPSFGAGVDTDFLLGVGKVEKLVIMLLDVDRVLSSDELAITRNAAETA